MSVPPYIGLTGVAGSGKDTVFERMVALGGERFVRLSVADPLKESVAALFGISLEHLDELKRDSRAFVDVGRVVDHQTAVDAVESEFEQIVAPLSMRTFLQRYGTEAHRDVFGQDFWIQQWLSRCVMLRHETAQRLGISPESVTIVNTSVRFPNEAERIISLGGAVWEVVGPQDYGAAGHASEEPLDASLVEASIDNHYREMTGGLPDGTGAYPDFSYLDDQITDLIYGGHA